MMKYMLHLVIDGYNLMHVLPSDSKRKSLEERRSHLVRLLYSYQLERDIEVSIFFDGSKDNLPDLLPARDRFDAIRLYFSDQDQTADEAIEDFLKKNRGPFVVVSNDHEVIRSANLSSNTSILSTDFAKKLKNFENERFNPYYLDKEVTVEEEDESLYPRVTTKKKGASKRLSKKDRKKLQQLKNL